MATMLYESKLNIAKLTFIFAFYENVLNQCNKSEPYIFKELQV